MLQLCRFYFIKVKTYIVYSRIKVDSGHKTSNSYRMVFLVIYFCWSEVRLFFLPVVVHMLKYNIMLVFR